MDSRAARTTCVDFRHRYLRLCGDEQSSSRGFASSPVNVDLNPIRAGIVDTPERSKYTSAFDRIQSRSTVRPSVAERCELRPVELPTDVSIGQVSPGEQRHPDSWLCELTLPEGQSESLRTNPPVAVGSPGAAGVEATVTPGNQRSGQHRAARASDQGYLPIQLDRYLLLLDWTGRQLRAVSQGTIPAQLAPILERLGVNGDGWVETVRQFGRWFKTAAGRRDSLARLAARRGKAWLQGQSAAALAFR